MDELLKVGGQGFLIPVVMAGILLYGIKGLYELFGRRSRHRKEFLDLWDPARAQDDVWLEMITRHHFGTFMPAGVIRIALAQPDKCLALYEVRDLWPLFHYDRETQTVSWVHRWHVTRKGRGIEVRAMFPIYVAAALTALWFFKQAASDGPMTSLSWLYAFGGIAFVGWALISIVRGETMGVATRVGDEWVERINQHRKPPADQVSAP